MTDTDLEVLYEVFKPTFRENTKHRVGSYWWLHGKAQTYSGDADTWIRLQNAGLVSIDHMRPSIQSNIYDITITELGRAKVAEHHPGYRIEWENTLINSVERSLAG